MVEVVLLVISGKLYGGRLYGILAQNIYQYLKIVSFICLFVCFFFFFFSVGRGGCAFLLFSEGKPELTDFDKNPVSGLWQSPLLDCFT